MIAVTATAMAAYRIGLRIRLELKLIEPMHHNPCTLLVQHFLRAAGRKWEAAGAGEEVQERDENGTLGRGEERTVWMPNLTLAEVAE